jgi:uncharacterized cupin superfamily protein
MSNAGETKLRPGMCAGFKAANGDAHHLVNRSRSDVVYLEIGDRNVGEEIFYPDDDIHHTTRAGGEAVLTRKDGTPS